MENQRLILFIALSFVLLMLWEAWQRDYGPQPEPASVTQQAAGEAGAGAPAEDLPTGSAPAVPGDASLPAVTTLPSGQRLHVVTDVFDIEIDTRGGDIRRVDLLQYPQAADRPEVPVRLLDDQPPNIFIAQSGLRSDRKPEPTHHVQFQAEASEYRLAEGQEELVVPLVWTSPDGVKVIKQYRFRRGDYLIDLDQIVTNGSDQTWTGRQYRQLQRAEVPAKSRMGIQAYTGGVIYSPEEKYEKITFSDMAEQDLSRDIRDGWAAMIQHYFLGALIPPRGETDHYYSKALGNDLYVLGLIGPNHSLQPGESVTFNTEVYLGPKLQARLAEIAEGLELTVDYGVLTVLAKPIYWLMEKIYALVGNWGWTIIILTLLIKLAFYKPSEMSYKSMAQMRKLGPRLQKLKERYGDDKQKLNQAMMEMYRTEKINPLGGCLPILIQIPVFIALYWVLLESVEMRQAPFILWLTDLSSKDPYYILPLIMGVTMFIQQKLNPAPMDPIQAKVMMMLPVVFTVFFAFFPSGLVLYWVTNNVLSIAQQWVITRRIEQEK
ncbi:membrane protein insertase YidC [Thiohalobacter sp. IOR34]|uniref:membrane protein insertase YidC n=1 Tax=Thiohalobacter sp. IOR34 TaxID=3057176 RepID=UPI0025AF5210|nr:membrane protein insertase YidC [Thiohalobacter sp. IOR34]WJW75504.1 membrane protein insertase YidC [Thiohalobacter sp. IOR34]